MGTFRRELHDRNDAGFWAGISGGVTLVLGWVPLLGATFADIFGVLAIILGLVGMTRPGSKRMALLGVGLGVVMLVLKHLPILNVI